MLMKNKMNSNFYTFADFMKSDGNVFEMEINGFYDFLDDAKKREHFHYERPLFSGTFDLVG